MKYLLMIHLNPTAFESLSEEKRAAIFSAHDVFSASLKETGELVGFAALANPSNTTTVRVRDRIPAVTDGPYVEAKEFLAGFYLVDYESNVVARQYPNRLFWHPQLGALSQTFEAVGPAKEDTAGVAAISRRVPDAGRRARRAPAPPR